LAVAEILRSMMVTKVVVVELERWTNSIDVQQGVD
jgi:hypothetical protein